MMILRRWAVGPSVNNSFPEHIFESTCPIVCKFYTQHPRGSSCAFWGIWALTYFWFRTMTYLDVLTHTFRSRSRKVLGRWQSYCTYMFSKVPSCAFSSFWTLTLKLTRHFDLIYNIGKSNLKILRNIMKTAQDSHTITIKQIVRFQERMHLEKYQVDKIKNGRLSAIIHLDRPDIAEYHENCSR